MVCTVSDGTWAELAATTARMLFHEPVLAACRGAKAAAVRRLGGKALQAALAEDPPRMTMPLPPPPGDVDGVNGGGGGVGGSGWAPAVDSSYKQALRALVAAAMTAVGLLDDPAPCEGVIFRRRKKEGHSVVVTRALLRVNHRPSLDALVSAAPVHPSQSPAADPHRR